MSNGLIYNPSTKTWTFTSWPHLTYKVENNQLKILGSAEGRKLPPKVNKPLNRGEVNE